jgi:hypothetical protein
VAGTGVARIGDVETTIANGDVSIVPLGVVHNFRNTGSGMLKLFTTYSPSEHTPGTSSRFGRRESCSKNRAEGDSFQRPVLMIAVNPLFHSNFIRHSRSQRDADAQGGRRNQDDGWQALIRGLDTA